MTEKKDKILRVFFSQTGKQIKEGLWFMIIGASSNKKCWCCGDIGEYQTIRIKPEPIFYNFPDKEIYDFCWECLYEINIIQRDLWGENVTSVEGAKSIRWDITRKVEPILHPPHLNKLHNYYYKLKWKNDYVDVYMYCARCKEWFAEENNLIAPRFIEEHLLEPLIFKHEDYCKIYKF